MVRDVIVRYSLLKPGPEPYITPFSKKGPFKTKLCSVQTLALMYSKEEQVEDMQKKLGDTLAGSCSVDMAMEKSVPENVSQQEINHLRTVPTQSVMEAEENLTLAGTEASEVEDDDHTVHVVC